MDRRSFLTKGLVAGGVAAIASGATGRASSESSIRIVGISCSPRKDMTTAASVRIALEQAKKVGARVQTEFLDLGSMNFSGWNGTGKFEEDDFDRIVLPVLKDPVPDGIIIGSPVYFRNISSLCMAFLERLAVLRKPELLLADVPVGVLSVGGYRNGGQEMAIQQIQAAMLCHEVFLVGGKPGAHQGATLVNAHQDVIAKDEFGVGTARQLGTRVAQAALRLKAD